VSINTAHVHIWGKLVGAIAWNNDSEYASFEYDPAFKDLAWELAPLKMPLTNNQIYSFPANNNETFKGLPGLLADTLPDKYGNRLINMWLARKGRGIDNLNPIERLCFIGKRGMGALEFEPSLSKTDGDVSKIEIDGLVEITHDILQNKESLNTNLSRDKQKALMEIIKIGTSAGGARSKAIIAYNSTTGEVRSGQTNTPDGFEHWLIKLDSTDDLQLGNSAGWGRIEMAYYHMAKDCGINMMESQLLEENDRAHFMTKRFDREKNNQKHHIQTFCAMQHYDFNEVNSYSYEQLFQTMRELHLPSSDAEQMFRRMVFNVMAKNCDDHTKNFAFRLKEGQDWELAPAYDICYAYNNRNKWINQHALSINGKRKNINKNDFLNFASSMNIKKPKQIITDISDIVSSWKNYADTVGVIPAKRDAINEELIVL